MDKLCSKSTEVKWMIESSTVLATMICSCFSVVVAANKAIHSSLHEKMKTRGIHTEVIYNLSPSHNISESLKNFGIQDTDTNLLLICIYEKGVGNKVESYVNEVDGTQCQMEELQSFTDVNALKQLYKVTEEELKIGALSDAIVCRIATKDAS